MPVPQHRVKYREPALFTARDFHRYVARVTGQPRPRAPRTVLLLFGRRWNPYLSRRFPRSYDRGPGLYRVAGGVGAAVLPAPGAPLAGIEVEELGAIGATRFVIVGYAGSLQPGLRAGSIVVCRKALRDEGTSHHYARPGRFAQASAPLLGELRRGLDRQGVEFRDGASWTIDAPYRETRTEIRRYRREGLLTVEMEAAAVFAVAARLGLQAGAVFVVSDHLDDSGWEPRFHDSRRPLRQAFDRVVAAVAR